MTLGLLLFANIAYDWLIYRWLSPLSAMLLVILGVGTLLTSLRGKPLVSTEGMTTRFLVTLVFIFATLTIVFGYIVFSSLLRR